MGKNIGIPNYNIIWQDSLAPSFEYCIETENDLSVMIYRLCPKDSTTSPRATHPDWLGEGGLGKKREGTKNSLPPPPPSFSSPAPPGQPVVVEARKAIYFLNRPRLLTSVSRMQNRRLDSEKNNGFYQLKVDVRVLNIMKNYLADVSSVNPSSDQFNCSNKGLTLETSAK